MKDANQEKNRLHYESLYSRFPVSNILYWINNLDRFLDTATTTETSWYGLYLENFRDRIKGKKVLEMGCGDCTNAAVMAALGAEVYANDIATSSGEIVRKLNEDFNFDKPIVFIEGDFLDNNLTSGTFDFVVGKAFLHHLTLPIEKKFIEESARLLKPDGEARFFEPAVNSRILDEIRWHISTKGRPSKFKKEAFRKWKENDPHPDRSFSSKHFEEAGKNMFANVQIYPVGTLERFHKFLEGTKYNNRFRKWAFRAEKKLPNSINRTLTRSQLIVYQNPIL